MTVNFRPWAPQAGAPLFLGLRLLLLGESHYDDWEPGERGAEEAADVTAWVVERHALGVRRRRFFGNVFEAVTGDCWSEGSQEVRRFWQGVWFYNFIQDFVGPDWSCRPTGAMFRQSAPAFFEVLNEIRPDAVLVLGKTLWSQMPDADLVATDAEGLSYKYQWIGGDAQAACTRHPSRGFSPGVWHPHIANFLDAARTR